MLIEREGTVSVVIFIVLWFFMVMTVASTCFFMYLCYYVIACYIYLVASDLIGKSDQDAAMENNKFIIILENIYITYFIDYEFQIKG